MKRFNTIFKDEEGNLSEKAFFGTKAEEIKKLKGVISVVSSERVRHPSPDVLQRVIIFCNLEKISPTLPEFYTLCDKVKTELETTIGEETPDTPASADA